MRCSGRPGPPGCCCWGWRCWTASPHRGFPWRVLSGAGAAGGGPASAPPTRALGGAALLLALGNGLHQGLQGTPLFWLRLLAMATIVGLALLLNRETAAAGEPLPPPGRECLRCGVFRHVAGETEWVSASIEALTGWRPGDLIGRPFGLFVHPGDLPLLVEADAAFRRGETIDSSCGCAAARWLRHRGGERPGAALARRRGEPPSWAAGGISTRNGWCVKPWPAPCRP